MKLLMSRKTDEMLKMVAANYIIGLDALKRAELESKDFVDAIDKLTSNTISLAFNLCGQKGVDFINRFSDRYRLKS